MPRSTVLFLSLTFGLLANCQPKRTTDQAKSRLQLFSMAAKENMDQGAVLMDSLLKASVEPGNAESNWALIHALAKQQQQIRSSLDSINYLIQSGDLLQPDFQPVRAELNQHRSLKLNRQLKENGIDVSMLPRTNVMNLTEEFSSRPNQFSGRLPAGWITVEDTAGYDWVGLGPERVDQDGLPNRDALMFILNKSAHSSTLDEYYSGNLMTMKRNAIGFSIVEEFNATVGGDPAKYLMAESLVSGRRMTSVQFYLIHEGKPMCFAGSTVAADPDRFARAVSEVMGTITFTID